MIGAAAMIDVSNTDQRGQLNAPVFIHKISYKEPFNSTFVILWSDMKAQLQYYVRARPLIPKLDRWTVLRHDDFISNTSSLFKENY